MIFSGGQCKNLQLFFIATVSISSKADKDGSFNAQKS